VVFRQAFLRAASVRHPLSIVLTAALVASCTSNDHFESRAPSAVAAEAVGDGGGPAAASGSVDDADGVPPAAAGDGGAAANVPGDSGTPVASSGSTSSSDAGQLAGGEPEPPIANLEPGVHLVGRMETSDAAGPRFAWSGSGVVAEFSGTEVTLRLDDSGQNQFTVVIDGELAPKLMTVAGPNDYLLVSGLVPGTHRIEIYRRTEASFGPTQFLGFDFGADGVLLPQPPVARRIEIIGDSVSAGYGNEGMLPCGFTPDTENHYLTYGAIAARALGAELTTVAWSGKGIVYNYDMDTVEPMPALYGRTLPQDSNSTYDFATAPDVVVINLGTNDFSTEGDPTIELFADEYTKLLERVRAAYPTAFILGTVGPLLSGADLSAARAGIAAGVSAFEAAGGSNVRAWEMNVPNGEPPGCDSHPNLATHQAMADALIPELDALFD
jgi:lysophospholipase L1-like esterase